MKEITEFLIIRKNQRLTCLAKLNLFLLVAEDSCCKLIYIYSYQS